MLRITYQHSELHRMHLKLHLDRTWLLNSSRAHTSKDRESIVLGTSNCCFEQRLPKVFPDLHNFYPKCCMTFTTSFRSSCSRNSYSSHLYKLRCRLAANPSLKPHKRYIGSLRVHLDSLLFDNLIQGEIHFHI